MELAQAGAAATAAHAHRRRRPGRSCSSHVAEYADGWIPIGGAGVRAALPALHEAWASAGRTAMPEVVPFGVLADAGKLDYYEEIGCSEVVLRVDGAPGLETLRALDALVPLLDR